MRMALALHTMRQHSRPRCLLAELRFVRDVGSENDQCAWRTHLSDCWSTDKGCSNSPAQTMRVEVALHTVRQHSQPGYLLIELKAVGDVASESDL